MTLVYVLLLYIQPESVEIKFFADIFSGCISGSLEELVDDDLYCDNYDMLDNRLHMASPSFI